MQLRRNKKVKKKKTQNHDIAPDEIFLDSTNLPDFDRDQFEGRIEKPISRRPVILAGVVFVIIGLIFTWRIWDLQVMQGAVFATRSANNSLHDTTVFADRGVIYDRNNVLLAWNVPNPDDQDFSKREYASTTGLADLIGYVKYPSKDSSGFYYREDYVGMDGIEKYLDSDLKGQNGTKITETDAAGQTESQSVMNPPVSGQNITLSIDSRLQSAMYSKIQDLAGQVGFSGGAGVIMNVHTGEILTEVSYPEYNSQVLTDGTDTAAIDGYFTDKATPLLNRAIAGLYTPGSIVKPIMALAALDTGTIAATTVIDTHGYITVPNPYDPAHPSIFHDWQNNGPLDMAKAIQESSDAYFYEVGGGYGSQPGMGIANIDKYAGMFGYGKPIPSSIYGGVSGTVPSPAWKASTFNGAQWLLGDTYHSVIGQYGWQVTPIQVVRAIGAVANDGTLLTPTIIKGDTSQLASAIHINLPQSEFDVVHQGMRQSAEMGTGDALDVNYTEFATKTGTAQTGTTNQSYNSWIVGFWPLQDPQYSFAIVMEHGPAGSLFGAPYVSRQFFDWMYQNTPEYFSTPSSGQ
jgi:penicillin-binding protein 2